MSAVLTALQALVLIGFATSGAAGAVFLAVAARSLRRARRGGPERTPAAARLRELPKPVSVLVPARNEEAAIVGTVRSLLELDYPEFEVIVVSDGSTDGTLRALVEAYGLEPAPDEPYRGTAHEEVRGSWRSARFPQLVLLDKAGGGRADALNAGLDRARYPLVCTVDAGASLDADALLRAALRFVLDDDLLALGAPARVGGGADEAGEGPAGAAARAPGGRTGGWTGRFSAIEHARAPFARSAAFDAAGMLPVLPGPFGLYRRQTLLDLGGWRAGLADEDAELILRAHHAHRLAGRPCRVAYAVEPLGRARAPSDPASLRRARAREQRGLLEALWEHRAMLLSPRHGRLGMIALPWWWLFEALAPFGEIGGWLLFVLLASVGRLEPAFAAAFLGLAVAYGALTSVAAFVVEALLRGRPASARERRLLLAAALLEGFGHRQLVAWTRLVASLRYRPSSASRASSPSSR